MEAELKKEIIELIRSLQNQDSVEIGNSKTGVIKVYCDFNDVEAAEYKLNNAIGVLMSNRTKVLEI